MHHGINAFDKIRQKDDNILQMIPFNSKRKKACTVIRHPDNKSLVRVFLKGAPEFVISYCDKQFNQNGDIVDLTKG